MPDERTATRELMRTAPAPRQAAIYVRVSTADQNVANQQRELEAVAERHGWKVVDVFSDHGVSGAKDKRPALDRLRQGIARKDFDVVAAWSVDRLGRSLQHLLGFLGELRAKNVDLYLHQQGLDTSTPAGKALFQMLGVFAEFERAIIIERVHAGLRRARAQGIKLGRPKVHVDIGRLLALRAEGESIRNIARTVGCSATVVAKTLRSSALNPGSVEWFQPSASARQAVGGQEAGS